MTMMSIIAASAILGSFFVASNQLSENENIIPKAYSQESASSETTIKVTGDASTAITPDQATLIINSQTRPSNITDTLEDQEEKNEMIISAIADALGEEDANTSTITIGSQSINPYYSGSGIDPSGNVTFNVYASVSIGTNIDQLAELASALAEEGYGFESVYFDPLYSEAILREGAGNESGVGENPITISVSLNTAPDVLRNAIAEYEEKYRGLIDLLEEVGVSEDQIRANSVSISPLYYGPNDSSGYTATSQIVVRTDPDNIETITEAVRDQSAYVESVFLSSSDISIDEARRELTQQAMNNARIRAGEIAQPLGLEVTGIKSIETTTGGSADPYGGTVEYRGLKIIPPYYYQNINGQISASVTVEFELGVIQASS